MAARGISRLATRPHVAVSGGNLPDGAEVDVSFAGGTLRLPVRIRPDVPPGVACVSTGAGIVLPAWGNIARPK